MLSGGAARTVSVTVLVGAVTVTVFVTVSVCVTVRTLTRVCSTVWVRTRVTVLVWTSVTVFVPPQDARAAATAAATGTRNGGFGFT
jgi:hypothetical protein